ncbi:MAG: 50S ribosomal protein L25/general stress protein Ctc [Bacteroidales bacterium]|nr:50S ribosomal protein L25/general stress protein Ctc [Bacteroidales bacterium]MCL2132823.1 50S ribosomal protein L25/general stress protein Ctc [Bacteroidales bacterium]
MKTIELKGTVRTSLTKAAVKQLRNNAEVPCVLYGEKGENVHFAVVERELKDLVYTPHVYLVKLVVDGNPHTAVMREIQFHPVTERILHIDFYPVREDRPITIDIPVVIEGNSEGVRAGGKLQMLTRRLKVSALPKDLPDTLTVDITGLQLGKTIVIGNLSYPNLNILMPKTTIVCAVKMTRAAQQTAAAAEAEAKKK